MNLILPKNITKPEASIMLKTHNKKLSLSHGGTGIPYENVDYPLRFNNKLKEQIRNRDSYQCQLCEMFEEEHLIIFGANLTIHHIDYNKRNCGRSNLISLCFYCNARVNFNRNYWQHYFKKKVKGLLQAK